MPSYAGPAPARPADVAGTLRLLAYLALGITLIVLDHRGSWLAQIRDKAEWVTEPLRWIAGMPGRIGNTMHDDAATRSRLAADNLVLRNALLISGARLARLQSAANENARLRGMLGAAQRGELDVQLAPILNIDLDPTRQRLVLGAGFGSGVRLGQVAIDAGGVLGQVIDVKPLTATVLLLTDPDHAIPAAVARNGVRLVVYGRGGRLELANIPMSSDVKVGDSVVTSGLGGRFPAGFPVGTIVALRPDDSRAFLVGIVKPAAQLDRGREVLLLRVDVDVEPGLGAQKPGLGTRDSGLGEQPATAQISTAGDGGLPSRPQPAAPRLSRVPSPESRIPAPTPPAPSPKAPNP